MSKAVILMGSKSDLKWAERIADALKGLGVDVVMRISSAHKTPMNCYRIIKEYEEEDVVFITVAGRSNALSGFVDAQTDRPVIACPPGSDRFGGADIFSSLRMPSGVAPMVVIEPEGAALAAAKILGVKDKGIQERIRRFQKETIEKIEKDDREIRNGKR
jgi:5-(carboxyamino)imidazole ribonucleotide mutase